MQSNQLLYIASNHEIDLQSETFQLIDKAFKEYQPDSVIIEGVEERYGRSPQNLIPYIEKTCIKQWTCSEGLYSAHLAIKKKIDFTGAEPSDQEIYQTLKAQNYTRNDFVFFNFIQQLPKYYREGVFKSESELPILLVQFLQNWEATELTYSDFKNWYENIVGAKISYKDLINSDTSAPIKDGTCLQQLSSRVGEIRDEYTISVILKSLITHKKVLVIYGHSHFFTQKDVLVQYLGNSRYISKNIWNFYTKKK